jgi:hypothetical protein
VKVNDDVWNVLLITPMKELVLQFSWPLAVLVVGFLIARYAAQHPLNWLLNMFGKFCLVSAGGLAASMIDGISRDIFRFAWFSVLVCIAGGIVLLIQAFAVWDSRRRDRQKTPIFLKQS